MASRVAGDDVEVEFRLGEHIGVVGEKGRGKTTLAFRILQSIRAVRIWVLCCKPDEIKMWENLVGKKNVLFFRSEGELVGHLQGVRSDPKNYLKSVIYVDDMQALIDSHKGQYPEIIRFFVLTGRSMECSLIFSLHYARRFPPIVRTEVDHWCVFQPTLLARGMIEDLFSEELAVRTLDLDPHQFLYISARDASAQRLGPVRPLSVKELTPQNIWQDAMTRQGEKRENPRNTMKTSLPPSKGGGGKSF